MSSWRSKFRRNRAPDTQDVKPSILLSKNTEDGESHRTFRSRFLRRSKHEDETNIRPRSMYVERSESLLSESSAKNNPPTVQEILDKNRHLRRSNSKSPKSWKRLITGEKSDRSPNVGRKSENIRNSEYDTAQKDLNSNNYDSKSSEVSCQQARTTSDAVRGSEFSGFSKEDGPRNLQRRSNIGKEKREDNNESFNDISPGTRISHIRRQKSMQNDDSRMENENKESVDRKSGRSSRSGSPYDNVARSSDSRRRERRPRSLYFEETKPKYEDQEAENTRAPRKERRQRVKRSESEDTGDSQRSKEKETLTKKDSFVLRKPRAKYPVDDGDGYVKSETPSVKGDEKAEMKNKTERNKQQMISESTSGASLKSMSSGEQIDRNVGKHGYLRRSSENIIGATMNYLENRTKSDLNSMISSKSITEADPEDEADGFLQRRRRYQGLLGDRRLSPSASLRYENPLYKSVDYPEYERRNSYLLANQQSTEVEQTASRRTRPKSLFNYSESVDFSDSLSKFQTLSKDSSQPRESYSVWDRYKPRNDEEYKQSNSNKKTYLAAEESKTSRRPLSLFLSEDDKADKKAYRGNWSASVPKKPAHLRDFSVPEEKSSSRISYRRRESQQAAKIDLDVKQPVPPSVEVTLESPKEQQMSDKISFPEQPLENRTKTHLVPEIEVEDTDHGNEADIQLKAEDSDEVVVRRRRRDHAAPARPSSYYHVKADEESIKEKDTTSSRGSHLVKEERPKHDARERRNLLDSEDINTGLRKRSAVERRIRNKQVVERPKSVILADVSRVSIHDPLRDSVDDVKRQFERLLRRTEDWKRRTETLDSKATVLTSSYRNLRRTITELQGESDDVYAKFDDIGTRLTENDTIGFPNTEDEWRRAQEGNKLIEKATKILLDQQRNPKEEFYYSESESEPESPGSPFYDFPEGSPWSSPESHASRNRPSSDYLSLRSSRGSSAESPSFTRSSRGDYFMNEYSGSSSTRLSPLMSDSYNRRKRFQETTYDSRKDLVGLRSSHSRFIPETAV